MYVLFDWPAPCTLLTHLSSSIIIHQAGDSKPSPPNAPSAPPKSSNVNSSAATVPTFASSWAMNVASIGSMWPNLSLVRLTMMLLLIHHEKVNPSLRRLVVLVPWQRRYPPVSFTIQRDYSPPNWPPCNIKLICRILPPIKCWDGIILVGFLLHLDP